MLDLQIFCSDVCAAVSSVVVAGKRRELEVDLLAGPVSMASPHGQACFAVPAFLVLVLINGDEASPAAARN